MKVLIYGSKGWIGQQLVELFKIKNIEFHIGESRLENYEKLKNELENKKDTLGITHVISSTGRTHGTYKKMAYNTIDYLEMPGKLRDNMRDNYIGPVNLAELSEKLDLHYTYFGTGCIFTYDKMHTIENKVGFTEEDNPNFFGSSYSIVKGYTDIKMKHFKNTLNLRIRMPIIGCHHPRNFITKITKYEKIVYENQNIGFIRMMPCPGPKGEQKMFGDVKLGKINKNEDYSFSYQSSLWNLDYFYDFTAPSRFRWDDFNMSKKMRIDKSGKENWGFIRPFKEWNAVYESPIPYRPTAILKGKLMDWAKPSAE